MSQTAATPKHLWIVRIISLLWNLMGAFDYVMTKTQNADYMAKFTQEQLDFYYSFPTWAVVFWALAIWCSVLGSILLLMRKGLATPVFLVAFVSMVINAIYTYGFSNGMEMMGAGGFVFTLVIFFVALGLVLYSRAMQKNGVLV